MGQLPFKAAEFEERERSYAASRTNTFLSRTQQRKPSIRWTAATGGADHNVTLLPRYASFNTYLLLLSWVLCIPEGCRSGEEVLSKLILRRPSL